MITRVNLRFALLGCLILASLALPVNTAGTLAGTILELPPVAAPKTAAGQLPDPQVWTTWGASQYALAEDGESIWIGATGGAVRWNRALRSYRRYTAVDGLPHTAVLAVAVDAAGNRWFGGDGGLSRLDPGEDWTHFAAANSGLYADYVDAIAVGGSDTLYLSHGLPGGSVTRRAADGTWHWFPNRATAVQADYALIRQTRGHTRLWTVAGDEVWVGYLVYNGEKWTDRRPSGVTAEPLETAADSRHHLWALPPAAGSTTVHEWDGSGWSKHDVRISFTGKVTALAVAGDDTVWIGLQQREGWPYTSETARISQLTGCDSWSLGESGPVAALLPTSAGLWAIGPGWLMLPDRTVISMTDGPRFKDSAGYPALSPAARFGSTATIASRTRSVLCRLSTTMAPLRCMTTAGKCSLPTSTIRWSLPGSARLEAISGMFSTPIGGSISLARLCAITAGIGSNTRSRP